MLNFVGFLYLLYLTGLIGFNATICRRSARKLRDVLWCPVHYGFERKNNPALRGKSAAKGCFREAGETQRLHETEPLWPRSPYALARCAALCRTVLGGSVEEEFVVVLVLLGKLVGKPFDLSGADAETLKGAVVDDKPESGATVAGDLACGRQVIGGVNDIDHAAVREALAWTVVEVERLDDRTREIPP